MTAAEDQNLIDSLLDPEGTQDTTAGEYAADGSRRRVGIERDPAHRRQPKLREFRRGLRHEAAKEVIGTLPEAGGEIVIVLAGTFHGVDLFTATLDLAGVPAKFVDFATLAINKTHTELLAGLYDEGRVQAMRMLISDVFRANSIPEWTHLSQTFERIGQPLHTARNHAKIICVEFVDGRKFAIHGSLNLRRCNSYEQAAIAHDAELHDFFRQFIDDAIDGIMPS